MKRLILLILLLGVASGALLAMNGWAANSAARAQEEAAQEEPLEVFVPTEKVRADNSISFPVDI